MRFIPKIIYQTWKTKSLDNKLESVRKKIQNLNPEYEMKLFDDNDIETWIKNEFTDPIIYNTYKKLKIGAGRADFWRYLILYKNGGIYLDIDSNINKPLNLLINKNDKAIISREKNNGTTDFVQWCLMFSPKHPILLRTINCCIYNINNKTSTWLPTLTGPVVFTNSINFVLKNEYLLYNEKNMDKITDKIINSKINLWIYKDSVLNYIFNRDNSDTKCRFFGKDYEYFCSYDNGCKDILLKNNIYWHYDKEIFN